MMLNRYHSALEDAQHCINLDENFVKGYLRVAKCYMMLGNPNLSISFYDKALELQPCNSQAKQEVFYYEYNTKVLLIIRRNSVKW